VSQHTTLVVFFKILFVFNSSCCALGFLNLLTLQKIFIPQFILFPSSNRTRFSVLFLNSFYFILSSSYIILEVVSSTDGLYSSPLIVKIYIIINLVYISKKSLNYELLIIFLKRKKFDLDIHFFELFSMRKSHFSKILSIWMRIIIISKIKNPHIIFILRKLLKFTFAEPQSVT